MTRKIRNILFLVLAVLFLIATPLTILYSLGWRFDWETKKIVQTGVFYFKVWPKNVQIYLNGKLKKKTDLFFGSSLIENLRPKKYEIEIKKEGFHSWKKTLEIEGKEVTEAQNIVLIPKNPKFNTVAQGTKNFFFSPDNKKIILEEKLPSPQPFSLAEPNPSTWSLKLLELNKNIKSHLINEKDISEKGVQLINLKFSPDSKRILLKVEAEGKILYYLLEINRTPAVLIPLDFLNLAIEDIYFDPLDSENLFILSPPKNKIGEEGKELSKVDIIKRKISPLPLKDVIAFSISGNNIYYLSSSGFLLKSDFSFRQQNSLNLIPFHLDKEKKYKIKVFNSVVFLEESNKDSNVLYLLNKGAKAFQKFFESIKNFRVSPDSQKVVYFSDYEIWILFLEKISEFPQKEAGERLFISRFSEKISDAFWYTNHYLIFNVGNKIKVAEIDDRDRINIVDLAEFKKPRIFWANKKLFVLSEENLYVSEELSP